MITLANASVSYGVFDLGASGGTELPGPEVLAGAVHAAG